MPVIYIIILVIGLSLIISIGGLFGFNSEAGIVLSLVGGIPIIIFGLIPVFQYEGNIDISDNIVYETPIAYVSMHKGDIIALNKSEVQPDTPITDIKQVTVHNTCGLRLYTESIYKVVDITTYDPIRFSK